MNKNVLMFGIAFLLIISITYAIDFDGDGYHSIATGGNDCNDNNSNIHPGAIEIIDNFVDDDCDGWINESNYTIKSQHPRIFIENITYYKNKKNDDLVYNSIKTWADNFLAANPNLSSKVIYTDLTGIVPIENFALLYAVEDNITYGLAAKKLLLNFANSSLYMVPDISNKNADYGSLHLVTFAMVWDWIYPLIENDTEYKQTLLSYENDIIIPGIQTHMQIADNPPNGYYESNLAVTKWAGEILFALATYEDNTPGEYGVSGNNSKLYLDRKLDFWNNELKAPRDHYYEGGHTWDGTHYGYARSLNMLMKGIAGLSTATNTDYYSTLNWTDDLIPFRIHTLLPNKINIYNEGYLGEDTNFNYGRYLEDLIYVIFRNNNDTLAQIGKFFIRDTYDPQPGATYKDHDVNFQHYVYWFLWYDKNEAETDYTTIYNTTYFAQGVDLLHSRTDWNDVNATHVSFPAADMVYGYKGDSRQSYNTGSLKIWKRDNLLTENWPDYNVGTDQNYYYNTIFIDDGSIVNGWNSVKQTGGVIGRGGTYYSTVGMIYPKAEIDKVEYNSDYTYARGNLTETYWPDKISQYTRTIIYLKKLDRVVLVDKIMSVNSSCLRTEQFYVPQTPIYSNGTIYVNSFNSSRLIVTPLNSKPINISIEKPDDHTWTIDYDDPHVIKINMATPEKYENLIVAFEPTLNMTKTKSDVKLINTTNSNIIVIDNYAVVVSTNFSNIDNLTYNLNENKIITNLVSDLESNTEYKVYENSILIDTIKSSSEGLITFNSTLIGNNIYYVTTSDTPSYHPADLDHSGKIETNELKSFLQRWKQHLESFVDMFDVVSMWKSG